MKKTILSSILFIAATLTAMAQGVIKPAITPDAQLEAKIEKTLAKMTLDEKIGQMLELNLDVMGGYGANGKWQLNKTMLDTIISILDRSDSEEVDEDHGHSRHLRP